MAASTCFDNSYYSFLSSVHKPSALASAAGRLTVSSSNKVGTFKSFADRVETANLLREEERLKSFALWPGWSYARPADLAETGFYFTGEEDKVKCVECSLELTGWKAGQVPSQVHKDKSPYCSMITQIGSRNVPLTSKGQMNQKGKPQKSKVKNSFASGRNEPEGFVSGSVTPTKSGKDIHSNDLGKPVSSRMVGSNNAYGSMDAPSLDMKVEENRLATFSNNWSAEIPVKPLALAQAGFYYIGPQDRVICAFCRGKVYNWVPGDSPVGEHTRLFPNCTFVQELNKKPLAKLQSKEAKVLAGLGYHETAIQKAYNELAHQGMVAPSVTDLLEVIHGFEDRGENTGPTTTYTSTCHNTTTKSLKKGETSKDVKEILTENEQLKASNTCKVCLEKDVHAVFLPCGHLVCCMECSEQVEKCPLCRTNILGSVKAFRA
jgi:hypothetical protein